MRLRRAEWGDLAFLFQLRNDPVVRRFAFHGEPIPLAEHTAWFERKLSDESALILIAEEEGERAGQVRFDLDGERATVGIAVAENFRKRSLGKSILQQGCRYLKESTSVKQIFAFIKPENEASIRLFRSAGFSNPSEENSGFLTMSLELS
ncbi:MAG TPA: GNAT family N-acetyltransferase [Chroococcales cyanobacterium]|jgi:RimJ/RimL family protein N-acetyltransferase